MYERLLNQIDKINTLKSNEQKSARIRAISEALPKHRDELSSSERHLLYQELYKVAQTVSLGGKKCYGSWGKKY